MIETILAGVMWLAEQVPDSVKPYVGGVLILWLFYSLLVGELNNLARARVESGDPLGAKALKVLAVLNLAAINRDKAMQLWKGYRGPSKAPGALP